MSAEWQARIEIGGQVVGAGFLVAPTKVLTCAHVVVDSGGTGLTVSFPQRREFASVPARVVGQGGWAGCRTDFGDLAVLELDRPVPLVPAVFAPSDAEHGSYASDLIAYGFPPGSDAGMLASFRALPGQVISGEWVQLELRTGYGQPLDFGFSGAAVALPDGTVVGMVTAKASDPSVLVGLMLPNHVMARYWPDLHGLIPLSRRAAEDRLRLGRLAVRAVRAGLACDPVQLYNAVADPYDPPAPQEGFDSLLAAVQFVLCDLDGREAADTVARFADHLSALLRPGARPPRLTPRPEWSPILVEFAHSGTGDGRVRVAVSAFSAGRRHPVAADTVPLSRLRAYVRDRIDDAITCLTPGAEQLITFSVPRDWLDWPVDTWESSPDSDLPLGCVHPLVVTDHARRRPQVRHALTQAWSALDDLAGTRVERVECRELIGPKQLLGRLWQPDACLAGFTTIPGAARTRNHFDHCVTAPAPAIVWTRNGCGAEDSGSDAPCPGADDCAGGAFLERLAKDLARVPPAELPRRVRELRRAAYTSDDQDGHWAQDIQLLWDDPRCFTATHANAVHTRSPVV